MSTTTPAEEIEKFVSDFIRQWPEVFLVEVKCSATHQIMVVLDADNGITIDTCTTVNRALYRFIEERSLFVDDNFSLEVTSPGLGKPLKMYRQYLKNIGRKVEIELADGTKLEGTLTQVNEQELTLEQQEGKGKKAIMKITTILFDQIKRTTVLITF